MIVWHVVKVGGSLFEAPDLATRLRKWLAAQPPARFVLLAGGGEFADVIRRADERWQLGEEACHWLCIDALRLSARLLQQLLPEFPLVECWPALLRSDPQPLIFDPCQFLREIEPTLPQPLPHTWQATTDSLAARLAIALAASRLTLLKSARPPSDNLHELAARGYLDPCFPQAAENVPEVRLVDLRK